MYDDVSAANLPTNAGMVAGYLDGNTVWSPADWQRFAGAVRVGIVTSAATNNGHVLDVENGDAEPGQCPGWVQLRRNAGADPSVYCNLSTWPAVREVFRNSGVTEPHYWIADWTGAPHLPEGAVACQWTNGNLYDSSAVADYWPGVDNGQSWPAAPAAPVSVPVPAPASEGHNLLEEVRSALSTVLGQVDELLTLVP